MNKDKVDFKKMDLGQLQEKIDDCRRDLFQLNLKSKSAAVGDTSQFKKLKKDIARALTFIHQKTKDVK